MLPACKYFLVALSEADTQKYPVSLKHIALVKSGVLVSKPATSSSNDYKTANRIRQKQKRLAGDEINQLIAGYKSGPTVYELAVQFGCHRTTVSETLKRNGIKMRRTSLTEAQIKEAIKLYESGLSLVKVGRQIGANGETIRLRLVEQGVKIRDAHERLSLVMSAR